MMKPSKKFLRKLGELCNEEIEQREVNDNDDEVMNLVIAGWNGRQIELFIRDGTPGLERAIRKAIRDEGQ
jgi:hypothetical protein